MSRFFSFLRFFGFNPYVFAKNLFGVGYYFSTLLKLKKQRGNNTDFVFGKKYPVLDERGAPSGNSSGHYFNQDLFVAQKIFEACPEKHIDVGSRIDGFVAHVAAYRKIDVFDVRPLKTSFKNISFTQLDLASSINDSFTSCCDSISSLHAIEHFGLGRYGDIIDYSGHLKAIKNITKMLRPLGVFYFSVPIGKQRIEFNAHRVFSIGYLLEIFKDNYSLVSFSYVDDSGCFFKDVSLNTENIKTNLGCSFGCGIFEWKKH